MAASNEIVTSEASAQLYPGLYSRGGVSCIFVGPEEVKFQVHRELLCKKSLFFHGCLNGEFKEKDTGEIKLPEDKPAAFSMIVNWLYDAELNTVAKTSYPTGLIMSTEALIDAYILADKLIMEDCKNEIMNSICAMYQNNDVRPETIKSIEQIQIRKTSRLCQFLINRYAWTLAMIGRVCTAAALKGEQLTDLKDADFANSVIYQLVKFIARMKKKDMSSIKPGLRRCRYHDHAGERQMCPDYESLIPDASSDTDVD